jgi:Mrp family chromosome partitioning ATPase
VLPVADAVALSAQVDAVVMVLRHGVTLRHAASEARRRLEAVGASVAGYVLNAVPSRETRDYYADYQYEDQSAGRRRNVDTPDKVRREAEVGTAG